MSKLIPINSVGLKGETIREELYINAGGSEKTILIFESGRVVVMPVYKECPVQAGTIDDLRGDFATFIENLEVEKRQTIEEIDKTIELMKGL